jgi:polyvinyl alcohol dehydrogenase (cytochrome)
MSYGAGAGRARRGWRALVTVTTVAVASLLLAAPAAHAARAPGGEPGGQWTMAGQNVADTHYQAAEHQISPVNVSRLAPAWTLTASGDVTATPAVAGGVVYVPDMGGSLWAVNARTGTVMWTHTVAGYTGISGDVSRTTPAVYGGELITGDGWISNSVTGGAHVFAVNRLTGKLLWDTRVDSFDGSTITSSPVVYDGIAYLGIASKEEALAVQPGYQCCVFRGAVVAVNVHTGKVLWKTYTVPSNNHGGDTNLPGSYSGGAVWGSSPAIDPRLGLLYVGTGNNYTVPAGVCQNPGQSGCTQPDPADHIDSILALNLRTGAIAWSDRTIDADMFSGACLTCGPDYDFGSAPNLFTTVSPVTHQTRQLLGIGQKSGVYWAVDPATGKVAWHTQVGPGGYQGGIQWGSATDGKRIYVAEADSLNTPYTLGGSGPYAGQTVASGSWAALDAVTGKILWQTPDPLGAQDPGFMTAAGGVVYAGSAATTGDNMYALDAATGKILWGFSSGGSVLSGAAVVGGSVYWGSGYPPGACIGPCTASNKLYAFTLANTRH